MGRKGESRVAAVLPLAVAAALAAAGLVSLSGCAGRHVSPGELSILLVTLDTTRPDELGCYGSREGLTPHLDALAREGTVFEQVVAAVPMTTPSHASILTGLYPFRTGIRVNGVQRLADEQVTLAELLQAKGMATAAFVATFVLDRSVGLNQGFTTYDDDLSRGFQKSGPGSAERRAEDVTQSALRWLRQNAGRRFFLWVHYYDPHSPYEPPPAYATHGSDDRGRYRGEIAYVDANVGELVAALKELKLYDRTAVVAVGDHGEAFGEHGESGHGLWMYDSTLRVPLVIRLPRVEGMSLTRGRRVAGLVSLVDIAPTILGLVGVEPPASLDGRSLVPGLEGKTAEPRGLLYAETAEGRVSRGWSQLSGIYAGGWKYILAPRPELYDLAKDPGEERNQASSQAARAEQLKSELVEFVSRAPAGPAPSRRELDSQALDRLHSLGYLTGAAPTKSQLPPAAENDLVALCTSGPDPKDMVEQAMLVDRGLRCLYENRPQEALGLLRQARDKAPDDLWLQNTLSKAYGQLQMYDSALVAHRKVLELMPDDYTTSDVLRVIHGSTWSNMGIIYQKTGQLDRAEAAFKESMKSSPDSYQPHVNLAALYHQKQEYARADSEFAIALKLAPEADGARQGVRLNLAQSLFRRGKLEEARRVAQEAVAADPRDPRPRQLLGMIAGGGTGAGAGAGGRP